jgi:hypothetical protein
MGVQTLKRPAILATVFTVVLVLVLPFVGGSGPSLAAVLGGVASPVAVSDASSSSVIAAAARIAAEAKASSVSAATDGSTATSGPAAATPSATPSPTEAAASAATKPAAASAAAAAPAATVTDGASTVGEHVAQKPVPKVVKPTATSIASGTSARTATLAAAGKGCPANVGGSTRSAPGVTSAGGVGGTTSADLAAFAHKMNAIRVANCLKPIPLANFKYDSCMEQRLFWMAEDPSTNPASAWGHIGSKRSDGKPSVGCDGNIAGGSGNTGVTVAQKWWDSLAHRASLYEPSYKGGTASVCVRFAMTHGGLPNEPTSFTRAAATWGSC